MKNRFLLGMSSQRHTSVKAKQALLELAEKNGNVPEACAQMGFSRVQFYRIKKKFKLGGSYQLLETDRKKPLIQNRVPLALEEDIVQFAIQNPTLGSKNISAEFRFDNKEIPRSTIRQILVRNNLNRKGLRVQFAKFMVDAKMDPVEGKSEKLSGEPAFPPLFAGHLGYQKRFFVRSSGHFGRIFQFTYVDLFSGFIITRLYCYRISPPIITIPGNGLPNRASRQVKSQKKLRHRHWDTQNISTLDYDNLPHDSAIFLQNEVISFFHGNFGIKVRNVQTDRGRAFWGNCEQHDYRSCLQNHRIGQILDTTPKPRWACVPTKIFNDVFNPFYEELSRDDNPESPIDIQEKLLKWTENYNCLGENGRAGLSPYEVLKESKVISKVLDNLMRESGINRSQRPNKPLRPMLEVL